MTSILDHVENKPVLEFIDKPALTPTTVRRLLGETLDELGETLTPDQVEEVAEAFRGAGLL